MPKAMRISSSCCSVLAKCEIDVVSRLSVRDIEENTISWFGVIVEKDSYLLTIIDLPLCTSFSFDRYSLVCLILSATAAAPSHVSHHTILLSSKARAAAKKTDKLLKIQRFQRTSFLFFPFQKFSTNSDRISPKFCV